MESERKYYEAYDDRYRQVHRENLTWFDDAPSDIVMQTISRYGISEESGILEIGCGEGRDARFLLNRGYHVLATDVSPEAVTYCQRLDAGNTESYRVLDCLKDGLDAQFDFLYAVAVVHMLVDDADRDGFYRFIRAHLSENGIALVCCQGDGKMERKSDISSSFALQERVHEQSGKTVCIAGTSYRAVSFDTFREEISRNGLKIIDMGLTDILPDYWKIMYAVVKR